MDRNGIVKQVMAFQHEFDITVDDMVVGYEAAAVMHGIRDTSNDIDVDLHRDDYEKMTQAECTNKGTSTSGEFITLGHLDLHAGEHEEDFQLIDGIWVVGRKTLLRQYRQMFYHPNRSPERRKKDLFVIKTLTAPTVH